ncbi:hypothetical protein FKM82_010252 [Ascaphus truei]
MKEVQLPRWELAIYLLLLLGVHFYSFYEVYLVSREYEEDLDQEFGLERGASFWGLKKDPTDFEWSFWMEWGQWPLIWLMLGHVVVSQLARIFFVKLKIPLLTWLNSLLMLFILRNKSVENIQRGWYSTENEYFLLLFTQTVRCLYYTSFSLEYTSHQSSENSSYSFTSMLVYVFYYPVFHNGPIITFNEFSKQMQKQDVGPEIYGLAQDIARLFLWWWLAELMLHLMYIHAIYSNYPLLEYVSCWALGE